MLEKPPLQDEIILACLRVDFGLEINTIEFLPLGADVNTAVYRASTPQGASYFVKLRSGNFDEITVTLPVFLCQQGIRQVIAPVEDLNNQRWVELEQYRLMIYPFIQGLSGFHVNLSPDQWREFGAALKQLHTVSLPPTLAKQIPREGFSPEWRNKVLYTLENINIFRYNDPITRELAAFLSTQQQTIVKLIQRAQFFADILSNQTDETVVCHADIHAGNLLIAEDGRLFIIDWDNPILAPKERDLMFIGGCQGFQSSSPEEEIRLFYQGYGPAKVDLTTLAYYRYERIIQDIAAFSEQIIQSMTSSEDREQSLIYLKSNFLPGNTIDAARAADPIAFSR